MPVELMSTFLDQFLKERWPFFYKVCLTFLKVLELEILLASQRGGIMAAPDIIAIVKLSLPVEESKSAVIHDEVRQ